MKKTFKWIGIILISPILLVMLIVFLLYLPPVQNFLVGKATQYASEQTGMKIHIDRFRLGFPLDLVVEGTTAIQRTDTMLDVDELRIGVQFMPLLHSMVEVDKVELKKGNVNTLDLIKSIRVKGYVGHLCVKSHGVDLLRETALVNDALLEDANLDIAQRDSVPEDTTNSKPVNWQLTLKKVEIKRTAVAFHTPGDTISIAAHIDNALARDGFLDLKRGLYDVGNFSLQSPSICYDQNYVLATKGLDYNHLALSDVELGVDSLHYLAPNLTMRINTCSMKEKSGLQLNTLTGGVRLDSTSIHLPDFQLRTPDSNIDAKVDMDFNAFDGTDHGRLYLQLMAEIGKQDLMFFMGGMPQAFVKGYPNRPLVIRGLVNGNMKKMTVSDLQIKLETAFRLWVKGRVWNLDRVKRLGAGVTLDATMQDIGFIAALAGPNLMKQIRIPSGLHLAGKASADGPRYQANLRLTAPHGNVRVDGHFNAANMNYDANIVADHLQLHDFMPHDSLYAFTGKVVAKGQGTDVLSTHSWSNVQAEVTEFRYGHYDLSKTKLNANLRNGKASVSLNSKNPLLNCVANVDAMLNHKRVSATFGLDLRHIDLYRLGLTYKPLNATMCMHVDGATDLRENYRIIGEISDIHVATADKDYYPKDISLDINTTPDTTYAHIEAGSLQIDADAPSGYKKIMQRSSRLANKIMAQIKERKIDEAAFRSLLPDVRLRIKCGQDNPLYNYLATQGYTFDDFLFDVDATPGKGLNGSAYIYALNADSVRIDTLRLDIVQDSVNGLRVNGEVCNGPKNPQFVFDVKFDAYLNKTGVGANLAYFDQAGQEGIRFGAKADIEENGIRLHFQPERPIIAYRNFTLNSDNYVFIGNDKRVAADIDLLADDSTGIKVYSTPNDEALQDITIGINHLNVGELSSVLPYMPRMGGLLHGDFHLVQTEKQLTVSTDMNVENMTYEHSPLGNVSVQAAYLPQDDGSHYVDAQISQNNREVATVAGTYRTQGGGTIDANVDLEQFPLEMANGFMPEQTVSFRGFANGTLSVNGSTKRPVVNGYIHPDSVRILSEAYGLNLRLDDSDSLRVTDSALQLDKFNVYSKGQNPLTVNGTVNFSNLSSILLNLRIRAFNFTLVDAERTQKSLLYGKVNVNFGALVNGTTDNISVKGGMLVLGSSNFTYVLKDSPLTVEDRLNGLVTFVDFSDTTGTKKEAPALSGFDMRLSLSVEEAAQLNCDLSSDRQSYVKLEGGGNLTLRSTRQGDMTLTGRYTVNSGSMKYTLPVVPLKDFAVKSGSYIEFTGAPGNPTLNIQATEQTKASVSEDNNTRSVTFDVGVAITRTLDNMGLSFTLEAPEDLTVQNQLAAMSLEERGKLAVTMLATGMYLGEGNSGKMNANNALNAFLQSEISNIAGNALKTVDLSVGMESGSTSNGDTHTDYSFRFAKRFWGNRVSIIVGGKVSTGNSTTDDNTNQTFIDNVSLEYRLDKGATRYVRLFYDSDKQDILEGRLTETGGGLVLRKKIDKLSELFIFREKKKQLMSPENDNKTK